MTSLAFGFGCVPLAIASGAGANSLRAIGTGVIGGILASMLVAVIFAPLFFFPARVAERARRGQEGRCARRSAGRARGATDMRRAAPLVLVAIAAALLGGCTLGPNYVKPVVNVPVAWQIDYTQAADVANTRWWEQFDDPVLNDLIESSLKANRDLVIAAARVDAFLGSSTTPARSSTRRPTTTAMPAATGAARSALRRCQRAPIRTTRSTRARLALRGRSISSAAYAG